MQRLIVPAALATLFAAPAIAFGAAEVGSPAPAVEPVEWLNTKSPITWKDLKGRLVLVEKWATW
jgi:hypothetical protein